MKTKEKIIDWIVNNRDSIENISVVLVAKDDDGLLRRTCTAVDGQYKDHIYFLLKQAIEELEKNMRMDLGL